MIKKLTWPLMLIVFSAGFLLAEEKKALPPTPPEAQEGCDQSQPQNSPPDTSISSPTPSSKEKTVDSKPVIPAPSKIQENTNTGG
jgi:hypothetical protein